MLALTRRGFIGAASVGTALAISGTATANSADKVVSPVRLSAKKTALVIMHYQDDVISAFKSYGSLAYLTRMARLADSARRAGVPVYLVKISFSGDYREISPNNASGLMIKKLGFFTSDNIPATLYREGDTVVVGHRISAFEGTSLDILLRSRGIDTLVMAGIQTTGVVLSSVSSASDLDYRILLLEDGCLEPDKAVHDGLMRTAFATRTTVTTTAAVDAAFKAF